MAIEQRVDIESITWTMLGRIGNACRVGCREEVTLGWKEKSKNGAARAECNRGLAPTDVGTTDKGTTTVSDSAGKELKCEFG